MATQFHHALSQVPETTGTINLGSDSLRWLEAFLINLNVATRATVPTPVNATDAVTKAYVDAFLTVENASQAVQVVGPTRLRFDQADGFVLTNPSAGVARLDLDDIPNAALLNPSLTVTAGGGLSGGGLVDLGAAVTISLAAHTHEAGGTSGGTLNAAAITSGILAVARGGTGIAFFGAAGPTVARTYTFPDADTTIVGTTTIQTLTNKTLTDPATSGQLRLATGLVTNLSLSFSDETTLGFYRAAARDIRFAVSGSDRIRFSDNEFGLRSDSRIGWSSSTDPASAGAGRIFLQWDANGTLSQRISGEAQEFRLENTFTDTSNREFASLGFINNVNVFTIETEALGSGTVRNIAVMGGRVSIGTASITASALLDLSSTTGALLVPRMTTTQRDAMTATNGMIIYNTTTATMQGYIAGAWANM